ncbi:hypothetical protein [Sphingomonas montana]|uniref:hypothetical protein n=1 Tax=Sphingomonas montana TaxID=1843236 RepID=UPI0013EDA749|nr:hypothetical protein [Sphingomonas montana]
MTVPANCAANVELPARGSRREADRPIGYHPDISHLQMADGVLRVAVGSEDYGFAVDD